MAYQIAFDLYESATQHFMTRMLEVLNSLLPQKKTTAVPAAAETSASNEETKSVKDKEKDQAKEDDDKKDDKIEE